MADTRMSFSGVERALKRDISPQYMHKATEVASRQCSSTDRCRPHTTARTGAAAQPKHDLRGEQDAQVRIIGNNPRRGHSILSNRLLDVDMPLLYRGDIRAFQHSRETNIGQKTDMSFILSREEGRGTCETGLGDAQPAEVCVYNDRKKMVTQFLLLDLSAPQPKVFRRISGRDAEFIDPPVLQTSPPSCVSIALGPSKSRSIIHVQRLARQLYDIIGKRSVLSRNLSTNTTD